MKCGMYFLASLLAAALLDSILEHPVLVPEPTYSVQPCC